MSEHLKMTEEVFERQFVEATRRGEADLANSPKAAAARYDYSAERLIIDLTNGITIMIPTHLIQIFQNAEDRQIADLEIVLSGLFLRWKQLDEDLSVANLLQGKFGTKRWMAHLETAKKEADEPQKKVA